MKTIKKHNILKLLLNVCFVLLFIFSANIFAAQLSDTSYYKQNPVYIYQYELYQISKLTNADIVMFGDSHTQSGNWNELLGKERVVNRGIAGDDTEGMLARVHQVTKLNPKVVFILGGINDIYNWVPNERIVQNISEIVKEIKKYGSTPILQSVFYAGKYWGKTWIEQHRPELDVPKYNSERNKVIDNLNSELKKLAEKERIPFIDVNKKLSSKNYLKDIYSRDQLHLNAKGYQIWSEILIRELEKFNL